MVLSEVLFDPVGVNTGCQLVEIRNLGTSEVHLGQAAGKPAHWIYFPPAQWQFPPTAVLPPNGTIVVHVNLPGTSTATDFYTGISNMRDLRSNDAIGLFRSNLFGDPTQLVDFVEWGSFGNGGEQVAIDAGLWAPFTYVDVTTLRGGSSIARKGGGHLPADWCVDGTPTLGAPNDDCTPSYVKSPVIVNEIGYVRTAPGEYQPAVELRNTGSVLEDLGGKWIVLTNEHSYQFPRATSDTLIGPGELTVVLLGASGTDKQGTFYTGAGTFRNLRAVDSVSFHETKPFADPTTFIDFVEWGSIGAPLESMAVAAGVWKQGDVVDTSDLRAKGSLASHAEGTGSARWFVDNTPTVGKPNDTPPDPPLVIHEILVDPPGTDPGNGAVELKNRVPEEAFDAGGVTLCKDSGASPGSLLCYTIPQGTTIPPGGLLVVYLNSSGVDGNGYVYTGPFEELDPTGGVLLLFVAKRTSEINNLIGYVRWGDGPDSWESMAVEEKLWPSGQAVSTNYVRDDSSIAYLGSGTGADAYRIDRTPSIGQENGEVPRQEPFRRGDCSDDGIVDISDAIRVIGILFLGSRPSFCQAACDGNSDGALDISDPIFILNFLFCGGPEPPYPGKGPDCNSQQGGQELLTCDSYLSCG